MIHHDQLIGTPNPCIIQLEHIEEFLFLFLFSAINSTERIICFILLLNCIENIVIEVFQCSFLQRSLSRL